MISAPQSTTAQSSLAAGDGKRITIDAIGFFSFFVFGSLTSLNDILMPKLKDLFQLSYGEMTMVQFCFFTSYLLVSIPAAHLIARVGYLRSLASGFFIMAAGCTLFLPAAWSGSFPPFLGALFILAAGVTIIQVTANPLIIHLGTAQTTPTRLTFAHACNSIGTVVAPFFGAILILGINNSATVQRTSATDLVAIRAAEAATISRTYLTIAVAVLAVSVLIWLLRDGLGRPVRTEARKVQLLDLMRRPRFAFGVTAIGLYVGAEVTIGSLLVNYLAEPSTMSFTHEAAGKYLAFYWGGLLVGRLFGLLVLRVVPAARLVTLNGVMALVLILISINTTGSIAGWTMLAVGLFNSIMFPLIFALTSDGLGERVSDGSGILCVAIVGGAIVPLITGHVADATTLTAAFVVPALCYLGIIGFGWYANHPAVND